MTRIQFAAAVLSTLVLLAACGTTATEPHLPANPLADSASGGSTPVPPPDTTCTIGGGFLGSGTRAC